MQLQSAEDGWRHLRGLHQSGDGPGVNGRGAHQQGNSAVIGICSAMLGDLAARGVDDAWIDGDDEARVRLSLAGS